VCQAVVTAGVATERDHTVPLISVMSKLVLVTTITSTFITAIMETDLGNMFARPTSYTVRDSSPFANTLACWERTECRCVLRYN
jgi:hypothetical protein